MVKLPNSIKDGGLLDFKQVSLFSPRAFGEDGSNLTCTYFFQMGGQKPPTSCMVCSQLGMVSIHSLDESWVNFLQPNPVGHSK